MWTRPGRGGPRWPCARAVPPGPCSERLSPSGSQLCDPQSVRGGRWLRSTVRPGCAQEPCGARRPQVWPGPGPGTASGPRGPGQGPRVAPRPWRSPGRGGSFRPRAGGEKGPWLPTQPLSPRSRFLHRKPSRAGGWSARRCPRCQARMRAVGAAPNGCAGLARRRGAAWGDRADLGPGETSQRGTPGRGGRVSRLRPGGGQVRGAEGLGRDRDALRTPARGAQQGRADRCRRARWAWTPPCPPHPCARGSPSLQPLPRRGPPPAPRRWSRGPSVTQGAWLTLSMTLS